MMNVNVGMLDRIIRVWVGIGLMAFAYMSPDIPYAFLGWVGVIPFVTGLVGWCGLYRLLGISTVRS